MIKQITRAYVRTYSDNGQKVAYVEWVDRKGQTGRTEQTLPHCEHRQLGTHMTALFDRAKREGLTVERERW